MYRKQGLTLKWVSGKTGPHHAEVGNCHLSVTVRETIVKRTNIETTKLANGCTVME
jgi:hypothetical protein